MAGRELTVAQRLDIAERDLRDHSKSLSAHTDAIKMLEVRTAAIEEARRVRQLEEVRREEREEARYTAINVRFDAISAQVGAVKADVSTMKGAGVKVVWILAAVVIGAAATWILKGGFFSP